MKHLFEAKPAANGWQKMLETLLGVEQTMRVVHDMIVAPQEGRGGCLADSSGLYKPLTSIRERIVQVRSILANNQAHW
jgi:hypothetical protein